MIPMTPIAIIDFEASALSAGADVIEAGVAIYDRQGSDKGTIKTWSSLVWPDPRCHWDENSEAVHKISMAALQGAPTPCWVAAELNRILAGVPVAYCDGYQFDAIWMANLFHDGGITPAFGLQPWSEMPRMHLRLVKMHINEYLDRTMTLHRAGEDALILMQAYCYAIGTKPNVVRL